MRRCFMDSPSPLVATALAERGEDIREREAFVALADKRRSYTAKLAAELAAGPPVGREFEILRELRKLQLPPR